MYTLNTKAVDVINDPVFEDYGRLIFPVDRTIDEEKAEDPEKEDTGGSFSGEIPGRRPLL